jgi:RecG-like helicase
MIFIHNVLTDTPSGTTIQEAKEFMVSTIQKSMYRRRPVETVWVTKENIAQVLQQVYFRVHYYRHQNLWLSD